MKGLELLDGEQELINSQVYGAEHLSHEDALELAELQDREAALSLLESVLEVLNG